MLYYQAKTHDWRSLAARLDMICLLTQYGAAFMPLFKLTLDALMLYYSRDAKLRTELSFYGIYRGICF